MRTGDRPISWLDFAGSTRVTCTRVTFTFLLRPVPSLEFPLLSFQGLNPTQKSLHVLEHMKILPFLRHTHSMVAKSLTDLVSNMGPATCQLVTLEELLNFPESLFP